MKNLIVIALSIYLLVIASCNKNAPATNGGTWTLNGNTYKATQAFYVLGGISAYTGESNVPSGSLSIWFRDNGPTDTLQTTWKPKGNHYILTNSFPPAAGYAYMQLTDTSAYNSYVITGSTTPQITVDTTSKGLLTITIPPVMVVNVNGTPVYFPSIIGLPSGMDSSMVTGTVLQTQ